MSESNNQTHTEYIFTTQDPLGRKVQLKSGTWNFHITGGDHHRTEFAGQEQLIQDIIKDPSFIIDNSDEPNSTRQKYIDLAKLPGASTLRSVVVIVDHSNEECGDIVTVMGKKNLNQETGGVRYVRPKSTNNE
ncbi:hypothetical protein [Bacillus cereus]|uniref:hypothetical protein n=1 Tax=Bacillus cereus TaxID=1396 RepID=UPI001067779F|nr:hypothetical protein [Bacillus cereus]TEX16551.1 hypothetical protein E2F98_07615 [Bacillus cereus]